MIDSILAEMASAQDILQYAVRNWWSIPCSCRMGCIQFSKQFHYLSQGWDQWYATITATWEGVTAFYLCGLGQWCCAWRYAGLSPGLECGLTPVLTTGLSSVPHISDARAGCHLGWCFLAFLMSSSGYFFCDNLGVKHKVLISGRGSM